MNKARKPLIGYINQGNIEDWRRHVPIWRVMIPVCLGGSLFDIAFGLLMLHQGGLIGVVVRTLTLMLCPCQLFVTLLMWRAFTVAQAQGWQGDRWFQLKAERG
jgi:hypothetical protein